MTLERGHEPHPGTVWVWRDPDELFPQRTCSFCGSLPPEETEQLLRRPSVTASGSDWKYGWPHKFYVVDETGRHWKFYSEHLTVAPNFEGLSEALADVLQIRFGYDVMGRLNYWAPSSGFQTVIKDGKRRE